MDLEHHSFEYFLCVQKNKRNIHFRLLFFMHSMFLVRILIIWHVFIFVINPLMFHNFLQVILTCVPFTFTVYVIDSWPFGLELCKVSEFVKDVSIGVSVFTLTALSADRFFAIVDPMRKLHTTGDYFYSFFAKL